ncbi:MAG: hypothetical protein KJP17_10735 [Gammaproteobacteria bacterium]|nr:hypothetical protein [Gammaproteobacteria bacterium]
MQAGTYTHYGDSEDYEGPPLFIGVEYYSDDLPMLGFSIFNNSFGKITRYAYVGKQFFPWQGNPALHVKLTVGIAHGYEGKYRNALPLTWGDAWGIAAVPTIGFQKDRAGIDLGLLGTSGLILLLGYEF